MKGKEEASKRPPQAKRKKKTGKNVKVVGGGKNSPPTYLEKERNNLPTANDRKEKKNKPSRYEERGKGRGAPVADLLLLHPLLSDRHSLKKEGESLKGADADGREEEGRKKERAEDGDLSLFFLSVPEVG